MPNIDQQKWKSNIKTITSKNAKIKSIPLRTSYEVLRINENDYVQNKNEDNTEEQYPNVTTRKYVM